MILQLIVYILLIGIIAYILLVCIVIMEFPRTWIDRLGECIGITLCSWPFIGGFISFFYHIFLQIELHIAHFLGLPVVAIGPFGVVAGCYMIVRHQGNPDQVAEGIKCLLCGLGWIGIRLWGTFADMDAPYIPRR